MWDGNKITSNLTSEMKNFVVPVINLSNNINLSGKGTEQEPFMVKNWFFNLYFYGALWYY